MIALLFTLVASEGMQALPPPNAFTYSCDGGVRLQTEFLGRAARVTIGDKVLELPAGRAGAYSDGQTTFRVRNDKARLEQPGKPAMECVVKD